MVEYFFDIKLELTEELVMFNNLKGQKKELINTLICICKHYIYATKCKNVDICLNECVKRFADWYITEKYIVYEIGTRNKINQFYKKWHPMF